MSFSRKRNLSDSSDESDQVDLDYSSPIKLEASLLDFSQQSYECQDDSIFNVSSSTCNGKENIDYQGAVCIQNITNVNVKCEDDSSINLSNYTCQDEEYSNCQEPLNNNVLLIRHEAAVPPSSFNIGENHRNDGSVTGIDASTQLSVSCNSDAAKKVIDLFHDLTHCSIDNTLDESLIICPDEVISNDVQSCKSDSQFWNDDWSDVSDYCESNSSVSFGSVVESSSDECEDEEIDFNDLLCTDPYIYKDAPIRVSESFIAKLAFALRHNISGKQIIDLLELLNLHCREEENRMHPSLYFYKKYFADLTCPMKNHYFCSCCLSKLESYQSECPNNALHFGKKSVSSYVEIPIIPQLQSLFSNERFYNGLKHMSRRKKQNEDNLEDIYDGQIYKEQVANGFLGPSFLHHFSMAWNTDGIAVFHSVRDSLWAIYLTVNEIPIHVRFQKENMILGGLWFGRNPVGNLMMDPLVETFREIYNGFRVKPPGFENPVIARGVLLVGICDIPAKAKFMGMKQSGFYGCQVCKYEGDRVLVSRQKKKKLQGGKGSASSNTVQLRTMIVYKHSDQLDLRNHGETVAYGIQARNEMK